MGAENVKQESAHLRGSVIEELELPRPDFTKQTVLILKFHGVYQQGDRDARKQGDHEAKGSMVRVGIPGGILSAEQYLALDSLADEVGDGAMRITTRQDIQYHRVRKGSLRRLMRMLNENVLTTLAACGDVVRNVVCCPLPGPATAELEPYVRMLASRLKPRTTAWYEIWIDGEKAVEAVPEEEPVYGDTYLPRKFKIGFAAPGDNCVDVYTNDLGIAASYGPDGSLRFTLLAGGGMGMTPAVAGTHPRLADVIGTVQPEDLAAVAEAAVTIHRDFGNRENRRLARLKYVIEERGADWFREELERRTGAVIGPAEAPVWRRSHDHLGWQSQGDGGYLFGVHVPSGRLTGGVRTAVREIVERFSPQVRFTPLQNLLLTGLPAEARDAIVSTLRAHGVRPPSELTMLEQNALACPALPTCGLAITEAERSMPDIVSQVRGVFAGAGLEENVSLRVTGCPNGCARPYSAEIGLVGQAANRYGVYLGGAPDGTRLGELVASNVHLGEVAAFLGPIVRRFENERRDGEAFGNWCHRVGTDTLAPDARVEVAA